MSILSFSPLDTPLQIATKLEIGMAAMVLNAALTGNVMGQSPITEGVERVATAAINNPKP
jgi:hypothetical protein